MSIGYNPKIVTSGLVLCLDAANIKSFKGEPTTNLVSSPKSITTGYAFSGVTRTDNQLENFDGTFTAGLLSGSGWLAYTSASTTNGVKYTTSWYLKAGTNSTVNLDWGGSHQGNRTTFTFNMTTGAVTNLSLISGENYGVDSLGNGWWRVWYSSTLSAGNAYYPQISNGSGTMYVGALQIEQKAYATAFVSGTRGTTVAAGGGWADLSGNSNHGELVNNPTYSSTNGGSLAFNHASTTRVIIPTIQLGNGNLAWTCSAWTKTTTVASGLGSGSVLSNSSGGPVYSMMGVNSGKIVYWTYQNSAWAQKLGTGKTVNDGSWHLLTWVNNSNSTMTMYVDGLLDSNVANSTSGNNNPINIIGASWAAGYIGDIAQVSIQRQALSAAEVLQNFNAMRGRYGI